MDKLIKKVFTPFKINQLEIKNRLIMAPMTRSKSPNSIPGEDVAKYYKRRAEGEIGLIITEGTTVDTPNSSNDTNIPCFFGQKSIDGWKRVVDEVHESGGLIFPQLCKYHQQFLNTRILCIFQVHLFLIQACISLGYYFLI